MPRDESYRRVCLLFFSLYCCRTFHMGQRLIQHRFEYLWQDSENFKRPTKMSAPDYVEHLMTWVQSNIDNEQIFPSRLGTEDDSHLQQWEYAMLTR